MKSFYFLMVISICVIDLNAQCFPTQNFNSPGAYTYTVPGTASDTYSIEIETRGADGGDFLWGGNPPSAGGEGATMEASFNVVGGDQFFIVVGQSGFDALGSPGGGGGGGGSAVVINSSDVLIAAGAGGGGGQNTLGEGAFANTNSPAQGGGGPGASGGGGFNSAGMNGVNSTGGGAGTLTSQGMGGSQGVVAGPGGNGFGGGGGGAGTGGGGGGGYEGGDGSASGSLNGKGGDSFVNGGYGSTVLSTIAGISGNGNNINGSVRIVCVSTMMSNLDLSVASQSDPSCFGLTDGSIEVFASGGNTPYTYTINGGGSTSNPIFDNLSAGNYTIEVTDASSNTAMVMVTLNDPPQLSIQLIQVVDNDCANDMDGIIEVVGNGGTGILQYSINGGSPQNDGLFTGLATGFYDVSVVDANNCSDDITVQISSSDPINASIISIDNISCNGLNNGVVIVFADGGTGVLSYSIDGVNFQFSDQFTGLSADSYTLTASDANGCAGTANFTIMEPTVLDISGSASSISCNGSNDGSITVQGIGGTPPYTYSLDNVTFTSNSTFSNLSEGMYEVHVKDNNDCTKSINFELTNPDPIIIGDTISHLTCHSNNGPANGSIIVNISGGSSPYTYQWTTNDGSGLVNGNKDQTNLSEGTYDLIVVDNSNCSVGASYVINSPDSISVSSMITDPSCHPNNGAPDGRISLSIQGGNPPYDFLWRVDVPPFFVLGSMDRTDLYAGTYEVIVSDSLACTDTSSFTLIEAPAITISSSIMDPSCHPNNSNPDGSIIVNTSGGNGGYSYGWSTFDGGGVQMDSANQSTLTAGTYGLTVTDTSQCTAIDTFVLQEADELFLMIDIVTPADCNLGSNGSITLSGSGGSSPYLFILGDTSLTGDFPDVIPGNYNAMLLDANNCMVNQDLEIPQIGGIDLSGSSSSHPSCFGDSNGSIQIEANGGNGNYTYFLDGQMIDSSFIANLGEGEFVVLVEDDQGCSSQTTFNLVEPELLVADSISATPDNGSMNGSVFVRASGGISPYRYTIDGGITFQDSSRFSNLRADAYLVTFLDANGCMTEVNINVDVTNNFEIDPSIKAINLYPNPASEQVTMSLLLDKKLDVNLSIINIDGRLVWKTATKSIPNGKYDFTIDISNIESGIYFLIGQSEHGIFTKKLSVIK